MRHPEIIPTHDHRAVHPSRRVAAQINLRQGHWLENLRDIHHLPEFHRREIQHFFEIYKELEPGKSVEGAEWVGRTAAEAELEKSRQRLRDSGT